MKKLSFKFLIFSFITLSILSFLYLNVGNPEISLYGLNPDLNSFDVPSSTLPDVEAVKNTILIFMEMWNL